MPGQVLNFATTPALLNPRATFGDFDSKKGQGGGLKPWSPQWRLRRIAFSFWETLEHIIMLFFSLLVTE